MRARGYRQWPALKYFGYSHCYDCGALIRFDPESCGYAKCASCAQTPPDVRPPVDEPLPAFQRADEPPVEQRPYKKSKPHRRPCPKCGRESWTEGNGNRSCISGHVIRPNGEVNEATDRW